jgi:hypothetical protein
VPRASNERPGEHGHRSPGFNLVINHLRNEQKQNVLDLGPAVTPNIEFLSELQCKVYVEHLSELLTGLNALPADNSASASGEIDQLLRYPAGVQFDAVLAWDLLNYLEPAALEALVARLVRFCKRGTLLFALVCMGKLIPDAPMNFRVAGEDRLLYVVSVEKLRRCPQYSSPVLLKKLPGFSVLRSYLLQNNIQEYVFRFH